MSTETIIETIKALPQEEYAEIINRLNREDEFGLAEALRRDKEMEQGQAKALAHDEVFAAARKAIR